MKTISVEFGPPGQSGVTQIMGLGADEIAANEDKTDRTLMQAGWISVGVWALGLIMHKPRLRDFGLGGAAVAFTIKYVARGQ